MNAVLLERSAARLVASYDVYFNETQPINSLVAARKVILDFENARSGSIESVELDAAPGWNRARKVALFEDFPAGEYRFRIYTKRLFRGGPYDGERRPAPEAKIALRQPR